VEQQYVIKHRSYSSDGKAIIGSTLDNKGDVPKHGNIDWATYGVYACRITLGGLLAEHNVHVAMDIWMEPL
jgi:hypothetical protein